MQTIVEKAKGLKKIDHRYDGPSDTFNSMVSDYPISNENLDDIIINFSEMKK